MTITKKRPLYLCNYYLYNLKLIRIYQIMDLGILFDKSLYQWSKTSGPRTISVRPTTINTYFFKTIFLQNILYLTFTFVLYSDKKLIRS